MYRILLLDDKSSTRHAATGQPRATLRRLISGRVTGSDWTAPLLFLFESGRENLSSEQVVKGDCGSEPGEHVCSYLLVESKSKHGLNAPTKNPDLSLTFTSRAFQAFALCDFAETA